MSLQRWTSCYNICIDFLSFLKLYGYLEFSILWRSQLMMVKSNEYLLKSSSVRELELLSYFSPSFVSFERQIESFFFYYILLLSLFWLRLCKESSFSKSSRKYHSLLTNSEQCTNDKNLFINLFLFSFLFFFTLFHLIIISGNRVWFARTVDRPLLFFFIRHTPLLYESPN